MEKAKAPTAEDLARAKQEQFDKIMAMPRKDRRPMLRIRHGAGGMYSRVRSGLPTGTTPHFKLWMSDLSAKSALQRMKLDKLADSIDEPQAAGGMALLYIGGIKNVAKLAEADVETLLAIRGIGPKRLAAVEAYLKGRNVKPSWTVH